VALDGNGGGGPISFVVDSDAYEFRVRVSPEDNNYDPANVGVESGLINAEAPTFEGDHHLHLTTGDLSVTSIILGTDDHNVRTTTDGKIQITTPGETNHVWRFGTDGSLTLPGDSNSTIGENETGLAITSEQEFAIFTNSVESFKLWRFGTDGSLQIPGDIKSENAINIDINLSDSTLHRWRFGEDGELTLPSGSTRIGTLLGTDAIIANEDTAFAVVAQGTNGSGVLIWIEDSENFSTSNLAAVYTNPEGSGTVRIATGANGPGGGPKFWTFGTDGNLTLPGDIRSENAINIDINLTDSTLRRWSFGEDGNLTVPGDIVNGAGESFLKDIPQNSPTGYTVNPYVLQASDRGRHILIDGSEGNSIEIPTDATEPMPVGSAIVLVIKPGEYTVFVSAEDLGAMVIHGAGVGSNMIYELDPGTGGAMATLIKIGANEWMISGTGLAEYTGP
jgi:hypothetical protein